MGWRYESEEYKDALYDFANWVASEVIKEDFDEDGCFAELACRKLWRLEIIDCRDDEWVYPGV